MPKAWPPALPKERIGAEMRKLLAATDPAPALASMAQAGILAQILPGADPRAMAPLVHLEPPLAPRWQRRLAVLTGQHPTELLRLSRAESADFSKVRDEIGGSHTPAALGWMLGEMLAQDVILCRAALLESPLPQNWLSEINRGSAARCPVTAADLMPALQGAALGARLRAIEAAWLRSDMRLDKPALLGGFRAG
jgi:poly(A) polymerase